MNQNGYAIFADNGEVTFSDFQNFYKRSIEKDDLNLFNLCYNVSF
jgi:hypothetical protein